MVNNTNGNSATCRFSYQTKGHFTCARLTRLARLPGPTSLWFLRRNFSPVSEMRKGQRSLKRVLAQIREAKQTWRNTKAITFEPIIASATLTAVSLQLNGMLMMCTIQQAMRDDAIRAARSHPALFMCSYGKMSSLFPDLPVGKKTEFSGTKQAHTLI